MRVAFAVDNLNVGGTELNAVRTAEQLVRRGVDVRLIALQPDGPLRRRYEALGVPIATFSLKSLQSPSTIGQGLRLARFLRRNSVEVLHAHDTYSNVFAVPAARVAGTPLALASRRWWRSPQRKHAWANRLAYRAAHAVVANSPSVAELVQREGVPSHRTVVIPNFVEDEAFAPPAPDVLSGWRRSLGIEGGIVVGCVANLLPVKDHATLIRAAARVRRQGCDVRVVLVGEGECRAELEALTRELGLERTVAFAGHRPSQPSFHHLFDISALTSVSEGLPNSLLEAMAAGRPVVATDVGAIGDLVDDSVGRLVPASDPIAVAAALGELVQDADLRRHLGAEGRRRARRGHSVDAMMNRLMALYATTAVPARGPAPRRRAAAVKPSGRS